MDNFELENLFPMPPNMGPPFPRFLQIFWPWYKEAGPPPGGYTCPYCGQTFSTYDELVSHIQSEHAGSRIPIDITWT